MRRESYVLIDGNTLTKNTENIIKKYPNYKYYFGVVKNNAYHHGIDTVLDLKKGGINYFCVSSLDEAIKLRKYDKDTPVLCLEPIPLDYVKEALDYNVTLTVESLEYLVRLLKENVSVKVHIKIDSGMHRLGFYKKEEIKRAYDLIKDSDMTLEGIYSHFATSGVSDIYYDKQVNTFMELTSLIDLSKIPIVHFGRSLTLVQKEKLPFCNGIRLGIVLYGFNQSRVINNDLKSKLREIKRNHIIDKYKLSKSILTNDLKVDTAFSLYSIVMSVREVKKGDVVGYNTYEILEDGYILTLPIGYADGVTKKFGKVYIEGKYYKIVSDCMDMIMIYSKEKINVGMKVEIIGKHISIKEVCSKLGINAYHLFNQITDRVTYVKE